jgi:hypothetical protein
MPSHSQDLLIRLRLFRVGVVIALIGVVLRLVR